MADVVRTIEGLEAERRRELLARIDSAHAPAPLDEAAPHRMAER